MTLHSPVTCADIHPEPLDYAVCKTAPQFYIPLRQKCPQAQALGVASTLERPATSKT